MKLFYTPNSPYARICRIIASQAGLSGQLELVAVKLRSQDSPVIPLSPMGRIPVLVDGDLVLSEARHICAFLNEKGGGPQCVAPYGDWQAVAEEAETLAFLDAVIVWSREVRREANVQSDFLKEVASLQMRRELESLNNKRVAPDGDPPLTFETLCLVAALGILDFYELMDDWRDAYTGVADWYARYELVPAVQKTAPNAGAMNTLTR
ncbi:MAG: glutathione S-transferase family protein [Pseudomonadota bacterium]|nr:glutathione S-transferase family protein [Pseudomonadota bacterium]